MIVDITTELRNFPYITNLYKFIASYNRRGHQMGRKIGDMLEILTMGAVYRSPDLLARLDTEGKLEGYTSAGHKVEFGFYRDVQNKEGLFGAVECKCVGVEETISGKNNTHLRMLNPGTGFDLNFANHWLENTLTCRVNLISISNGTARLQFVYAPDRTVNVDMALEDNVKVAIDENAVMHVVAPNTNMHEQVPSIIRVCKIIRLEKVNTNQCQFALSDCLTGPQTIEKAKQASLVAMDLRKRIDGHWGKEDIAEEDKSMTFVHVICEFSHWETKSRNVIRTCIDHNIIIPDAILVRAFQEFEETFGTDTMLDKISKKEFCKPRNAEVREVIYRVIDYFEGHIFYDIELESYVELVYENNRLKVRELD